MLPKLGSHTVAAQPDRQQMFMGSKITPKPTNIRTGPANSTL
jgi:hypothetical protein